MYTADNKSSLGAEVDHQPVRLIESLGQMTIHISQVQAANRQALDKIESNIFGTQPPSTATSGPQNEVGPSCLPDLADALETILRHEHELNDRLLRLKGV